MEAYSRVLTDFAPLFTRQHDPTALRAYVFRNRGARLSLGRPGGWWLVLNPAASACHGNEYPASLLCCDEELVLLGECLHEHRTEPRRDGVPLNKSVLCRRWSDSGDLADERRNECAGLEMVRGRCCDGRTGWRVLAFMGRFHRLYVYDSCAHALILLAHDPEELARYGMVRCELQYKGCSPPPVPESRRAMKIILTTSHLREEVVVTVPRLRRDDVLLDTPGYGPSLMRVTRSLGDVRMTYPFSRLSDYQAREWWHALLFKVCCPWYPLGCVGYERGPRCRFRTEYLILVDLYGSVYAVNTDRGHSVRRVADTLNEFFCMGLLKIFFGRRRFEADHRRKCRLESLPACPHADELSCARMRRVLAGKGKPYCPDLETHLSDRYRWMCRTERYEPEGRTWETNDPNVLVLHRGDTVSDRFVVDPRAAASSGLAEPGPDSEDEAEDGPDTRVRRYFVFTSGLFDGYPLNKMTVGLVWQRRQEYYAGAFSGCRLILP